MKIPIVQSEQSLVANFITNFRIYYQYAPERLSACPVTIHALLHIADSIVAMGPVWCYWAFPMERYCGKLQPALRSHRFPYAALDRYVVEDAQLTQIKAVFNVRDELSLRSPRGSVPGMYAHPSCTHLSLITLNDFARIFIDLLIDPTCILLPPSNVTAPPKGVLNSVCAALATRYTCTVAKARKHVTNATIVEWGKVRRVDSEEGDTFRSSTLGKAPEDSRDATFVRVRATIQALLCYCADYSLFSMNPILIFMRDQGETQSSDLTHFTDSLNTSF